MMNREMIVSRLSNLKVMLSSKYPIQSMAVFGSVSRNTNSTKSDVDILVEFNGRIGLAFVDLAEELESHLGMKVDLVSKRGVKKKYLDKIQDDLIYV